MTANKTHDLEPILDAMRTALDEARLAPGRYERWIDAEREKRGTAGKADPYGCADAANTLYTLAEFPSDSELRSAFVRELQGFQDPEDGLFLDQTHHRYHVTAHCTAALELFEARPAYSVRAMYGHLQPGGIESFLDQLEWVANPWNASHQGAGVYAALVLAGEANAVWEDRYFDWLAVECDPATGYWRRGAVDTAGTEAGKPLFNHLAGSFHYLFNHEAAHRPLPYPDAMIDTSLRLRTENLWPKLGSGVGFAEIDWVFCLTRPRRQTGHRFAEVQAALEEFAAQFIGFLCRRVAEEKWPFEDLHGMFGTICAVAELQAALPGQLRSKKPLRLVLDRRPFI